MTLYKYATFNNYSGLIVRGIDPVGYAEDLVSLFDLESHYDRALLLACAAEGPKWGTVQSYDGCGISAGLLHHTATFPGKTGLGSFWTLYRRIVAQFPELALTEIILPEFTIPQGHQMPMTRRGRAWVGNDVREFFTGSPTGKTPKKVPPQVVDRVLGVHQMFLDHRTRTLQAGTGVEWLRSTTGAYDVTPFIMPSRMGELSSSFEDPSCELAVAVARSCAVNNPRDAKLAYNASLMGPKKEFPKRLYKALRAKREPWAKRLVKAANEAERLKVWPAEAIAALRAK